MRLSPSTMLTEKTPMPWKEILLSGANSRYILYTHICNVQLTKISMVFLVFVKYKMSLPLNLNFSHINLAGNWARGPRNVLQELHWSCRTKEMNVSYFFLSSTFRSWGIETFTATNQTSCTGYSISFSDKLIVYCWPVDPYVGPSNLLCVVDTGLNTRHLHLLLHCLAWLAALCQ